MAGVTYTFPDLYPLDANGNPILDPTGTQPVNQAFYQATLFLLQDRFKVGQGFPQTFAALEAQVFDTTTTPETPYPGAQRDLYFAVSILGMLFEDNYRDPLLGKLQSGPDVTQASLPNGGPKVWFARQFVSQVSAAVQEYQASAQMFAVVFNRLATDSGQVVWAQQVAEVTRQLVQENRSAADPQIGMRIDNVLGVVLGDGVQGRASAINVDLPDLDEDTTADIIPDNVNALAAVYFAAQLEELKFFAVADKVMEHFITGVLPVTRGPGGEAIYEYYKSIPNRFTEVERRSLYARAFGFAQGSVDEPMPNKDFQDCWIRFLSAESQFYRLYGSVTTVAPSNGTVLTGPIVTPAQVVKAAKDLAVNATQHGYGMAHFAAVELQSLVRTVKAMLSYDDVLKAYGALDVWQLTERVSQLYLGGSVATVQKRTMATYGANIIQWLARYSTMLSSGSDLSFVNLILKPNNPNDPIDNIKDSVERWLAVTGTVDSSVEKFSEPVALPTQTTLPNMGLQAVTPDSLRSALSQVSAGLPSMPGMNFQGSPIAKA
jgi:hypothetical protein